MCSIGIAHATVSAFTGAHDEGVHTGPAQPVTGRKLGGVRVKKRGKGVGGCGPVRAALDAGRLLAISASVPVGIIAPRSAPRSRNRVWRSSTGAILVEDPLGEGALGVEGDGDLLEEGVGLQAAEDEVEGLALWDHLRGGKDEVVLEDGRHGGGGEEPRVELAGGPAALVERCLRPEGEAVALPALERLQEGVDRADPLPLSDRTAELASERSCCHGIQNNIGTAVCLSNLVNEKNHGARPLVEEIDLVRVLARGIYRARKQAGALSAHAPIPILSGKLEAETF